MKEALRMMAKHPKTIIGIASALLFQLVFTVVWMTGYEGMTERTDRLVIGIVNEDPYMGAAIVRQLADGLPVRTRELGGPEEAARELEHRRIQMIMRIPPDFTAKAASSGDPAALRFTVNESNPSLIKNMMTRIADQITAAANRQAIGTGVGQMLAGTGTPEEEARAAAGALAERVVADIAYSNPVNGANNQMVPMMVVLASWVGVMIMGMNLAQADAAAAAAGIGKWRRFGARMIINAAAAAVIPLVGVPLLLALGGQSASGFLPLLGFEALFILAFIFVSQLFLILFGEAGMIFNIVLLSAQLVSSGAIMPRELLPDFYGAVSRVLPATYAVEGAMNLLFGGPDIGGVAMKLAAILAAALLLCAGAAAIKRPARRSAAGRPAQPKAI